MHPHRLDRVGGGILAPQRHREPLRAHRLVGVQQQHRQQRPPLLAAQRDARSPSRTSSGPRIRNSMFPHRARYRAGVLSRSNLAATRPFEGVHSAHHRPQGERDDLHVPHPTDRHSSAAPSWPAGPAPRARPRPTTRSSAAHPPSPARPRPRRGQRPAAADRLRRHRHAARGRRRRLHVPFAPAPPDDRLHLARRRRSAVLATRTWASPPPVAPASRRSPRRR